MTWQQMAAATLIGLAGGVVSGFFRNWWGSCHRACLDFFHGHEPTQSARHLFGIAPFAGRVFGLLGILPQGQCRYSARIVNCFRVVHRSIFGRLFGAMAAFVAHAKILWHFLDGNWIENVVAMRALRCQPCENVAPSSEVKNFELRTMVGTIVCLG